MTTSIIPVLSSVSNFLTLLHAELLQWPYSDDSSPDQGGWKKKTLRGHVKVEKHKNKLKMRRMNFKSIVFKFKYF